MIGGTKSSAATLSVASNSVLIALKIAAGAITGSIALLTEAAHSGIDLVASVIALVSVRKADEPPDREHQYGHEKAENLAAAIEGMLILVGAAVIIYEATRRLVEGAELEHLGVGLAVIGASALANLGRSTWSTRGRRARPRSSSASPGFWTPRSRRKSPLRSTSRSSPTPAGSCTRTQAPRPIEWRRI
jgi:cation diffusion facilitator family transporter